MSIAQSLLFTKRQLTAFAKVLRDARTARGMSQLDLAWRAFEYKRSHCKVSRVERAAMPNVDAVAIQRMAEVLNIPKRVLTEIDPKFNERAVIARAATRLGFWSHAAA